MGPHRSEETIILAFMGYSPGMRSRWLDIDQVLFACLWTEMQSGGP